MIYPSEILRSVSSIDPEFRDRGQSHEKHEFKRWPRSLRSL